MHVTCRYELRGGKVVCLLTDGMIETVLDVELDPASWLDLGHGYAKDAARVVLFGEVIEDADPTSFVVLSKTFAKDCHHVFTGGALALDSQPESGPWNAASFIAFGERYVANEGRVYCNRYGYDCYEVVEVEGADPSDFEELGLTFARAPRAGVIYNNGVADPSLDAPTFTLLGPWFARDRHAVYHLAYGGKHTDNLGLHRIDADPQTFAVIGKHYAADARVVYYYLNDAGDADLAELWPIADVSPRDFELLPAFDGYARAGEVILNHGVVEPGIADAKTFEAISSELARDSKYTYRMTRTYRKVGGRQTYQIDVLVPTIDAHEAPFPAR